MRSFVCAVAAIIAATLAGVPSASAQNQIKVMLSNRCDIAVNVALRSRWEDGVWRTRGWFVVQPRRVRIINLKTSNRVFYLYARTSDRRTSWSGRNREGSRKNPIVSQPFTHSKGPLEGSGYQVVPFRMYRLDQGRTLFTQRFRDCN